MFWSRRDAAVAPGEPLHHPEAALGVGLFLQVSTQKQKVPPSASEG